MKIRACIGCAAALVVALTSTSAESSGKKSGVRINLDAPSPAATDAAKVATSDTTAAPAAKAAPAKKDAAPKEEPKIEGQEVARGERGFLGVKVDGGFRITFYDADKKPVKADVDRIALRWPVRYQPNDERAVLTPTGDGTVLTSEKIVRPPLRFKLYVTLLKDAEPSASESYVIDFGQ